MEPRPEAGSSGPNWRTPAEVDEYRTTPDYAATRRFLDRLAAAFPGQVRIETFGRTSEGRPIDLVVVSDDGIFDPAAIHAAGRPILLVQNAIHAGEMDGKDACLALLRDLLSGKHGAEPLGKVVWAFIPIYNVDGHERRSPYQRINQNGPALAGWRANGANLNLNRDYLKADAPETRAFLRMFHRWLPDFFVDNHVTDGADFQYDVTFRIDAGPDVHPPTAAWSREVAVPELTRHLEASGHCPFPDTIFLKDDSDPSQGLAYFENPPRFSTGQMILENRPGLLVELHMLKPYRTRVAGNYELLRALLGLLNREAETLIALNRGADRAAEELGGGPGSAGPVPLVVAGTGQTTPIRFRGVEFVREPSEVSGGVRIRYGSKPWEATIPMETGVRIETSVTPPVAYLIPTPWTSVIEVLETHGVPLLRLTSPWSGRVERYRCTGMRWPERPFEGRHPILRGGAVEREFGRFGRCEPVVETVAFPAGSVVVPLQHRLAKVIVHWLEPAAPDSALRWGFFDAIFEQKEDGEAYVLESLAREMTASDPGLLAEFNARLGDDPEFAASPRERLQFFYRRSPWGRANQVGVYPVARLTTWEGLPLP